MDQLALDPDFEALLGQRPSAAVLPEATSATLPASAIETLEGYLQNASELMQGGVRAAIEAVVAEIDQKLSAQINAILHAPEYQALEASWRGLYMLVRGSDKELGVVVRVLNISKRELGRTT